MAQLDETDRKRVWRGLMRYWSTQFEGQLFSKTQLLAAVDATDGWIDDNAASFNAALPVAVRTNATAVQKTLLFCCVAVMRAMPGMPGFLRRLLGMEVD